MFSPSSWIISRILSQNAGRVVASILASLVRLRYAAQPQLETGTIVDVVLLLPYHFVAEFRSHLCRPCHWRVTD